MYEVIDMPRKARDKSPDCIYHIMCRSVSEFLLFRDDEDKAYYLALLKRYKDKYKCGIYAYCLMDNHLHLHFDARGFDVSKFMHSINTAYVRYYNKKYNRHGHVFQERFESRILSTDEYNLAVSAYIHNNAGDVHGYEGKEHLYPFSSYGIYLGIRKDIHGLLDTTFICSLFNSRDYDTFINRYNEFVSHQSDVGGSLSIRKSLSNAVENEYISGRRVILRNHIPSKVVSYISDRLIKGRKGSTLLRSKGRVMNFRALCAYAMRCLCGLSYREICSNMYNMTVSGCSRLCSRGYDLMTQNKEYEKVFDELMLLGAVS
jgi:REP element-mobilizing transposase RayT